LVGSQNHKNMEVPTKDNLLKSFASNAEFLPPDGDMFSKPLMEWEDLPVVHLQGDLKPTQESAPKTRALIDRLLPMIEGQEGYYGAGGGPLYLVFFSGSLEDGKWSKDNIPSCDFILKRLNISPSYKENLEWFSILDITHQTMFPRQFGEGDEELLLQIEAVISEVDPDAPFLGEFSVSPYLPEYIFESYPRENLPKQLRLLHIGIYCEGIHDGDCAKSCPTDSSMIISKGTLSPHNDEVVRFSGYLYSNPRLALFQTSEGHILGLLTLDYLD
jgi:hypothetical protein